MTLYFCPHACADKLFTKRKKFFPEVFRREFTSYEAALADQRRLGEHAPLV